MAHESSMVQKASASTINPRSRIIEDLTVVMIIISYLSFMIFLNFKRLHSQLNHRDCFTVHRGQDMRSDEFKKMRQCQGGLLSFNSFLSISTNRMVAQTFADSD